MFTKKEIQSLDRHYFDVRFAGCHCVVLQSKNTKHIWSIHHEEIGKIKHCIIYHKHNYSAPYHIQGNARNMGCAISKIKDHDDFQLNVRKKKAANF
jgi:hypothetical protein